jgi:hypothetical protein
MAKFLIIMQEIHAKIFVLLLIKNPKDDTTVCRYFDYQDTHFLFYVLPDMRRAEAVKVSTNKDKYVDDPGKTKGE